MAERLDQLATRFLTRRYLLALGIVALLTIAAQMVIQTHLRRQQHDAAVINLAGRQRMLSQELAKAALGWQVASDAAGRTARLGEVDRVLGAWSDAHLRLTGATDVPGIGTTNTPAIAAALAGLSPSFTRMCAAARALPGDPGAVARLLADEPDYLQRMEVIVGLYQAGAADHVRTTITYELGLFAVLLLTLVVEVLLVFRPAMRWLRAAIDDQERLREQESVNRELSVAAEVARRIGYDLHDGVGQTLTALSLQTKAIESGLQRQGLGEPFTSQIADLRAGIASAMAETRAAAHRLVPVDVQSLGLEEALVRLAQNTASAAGIDCHAACTAGLLDAGGGHGERGEDLYRIAQEAVANALRHGGAKAIAITLAPAGQERGQDHGQLTIDDDGRGAASLEGTAISEGVGMRSMHHHARRLGGTLASAPRPQGGWRVACRFPLLPAPPPAKRGAP